MKSFLTIILYFPLIFIIADSIHYIHIFIHLGKMPINDNIDLYSVQLNEIHWYHWFETYVENALFFIYLLFGLLSLFYFIVKKGTILKISGFHYSLSLLLTILVMLNIVCNPISVWLLD